MVKTIPNIIFSMRIISYFAINSSQANTNFVNIILQYFKGLINCNISYGDKRKNLFI